MIDELLKYVRANNRVCPMPQKWNELYEMLPDKRRVGNGHEPSLPLILGAWHETPALMKILRLEEHIKYADKKGIIDKVDKYLRTLKESDWAHLGDI